MVVAGEGEARDHCMWSVLLDVTNYIITSNSQET